MGGSIPVFSFEGTGVLLGFWMVQKAMAFLCSKGVCFVIFFEDAVLWIQSDVYGWSVGT